MSNLAFDTHQFVLDLTKAKMPEAQAEALARHYANLLNDRLATKDDLKLQGLAFKEDMAALRSELKEDMATLRSEFKEDMNVLEHKMDAEFVAVRSEIGQLEQKMDAEFAAVRSEMASEFASVRGEISRLDQKTDRLDQKIDHLEERLSANIINTALKTQIAGVVVICTIMGLMFTYFMPG
jgi:predicted nuclease with TOPRIM domain